MSSEIRRSSLDNPGHGVTSDDENVIHSEQSIIESSPGPSSIQGIGNDEDDSTETSQNQDSQQPQSESSNTENIFFKGLKTIFGKETEDGSNTQVTFHVHLPSFDYVDGYPIIVGNIEELGNWEEPIVKLKQRRSSEYMFQSSYWYSDPISIPANKFDKVKYRYAFFQGMKNKDAKSKEEGDLYFEDGQQQRLLTTRTGSQFDIAARFRIKNRQCELRSIREFMFLDIIYDSITSNNLGDKITEYQELLNRFGEVTLRATNFEFIGNNLQGSRARDFEKRIFLCIVLGYYIDWRQQKSLGRLVLPNGFPISQIIDTLEKVQPDVLPEECQAALNITMTAVIYLNMANRAFDWLRLFEVASVIDSNFTFIEAIQDLQYNNERMNKFLNEFMKFAKPIIDQIKDIEIYSNIGMWLFYNCRSLDALLFVWIRVIDHTKSRDNQLIKHFLHRVEQLISSSHATGLTRQFSQIPTELHAEVAGIFRMQALTLLKHRGIEWNRSNSEEILNILHNFQLKWSEDNFLEAMYHVSESSKPNLLLIFPNLLEYWFKNFKPYFNPEICKNWYHHLIDINGSESSIANDPDFILEIYENLSYIFPIVGKHGEILEELLDVAANRVKNCAMSNILTVTPKIVKLGKEIYNSYGEMVKALLKKSISKVDNSVIKILLQVCDCKNEVLHIQNELSENIVYHVMTYLEAKDTSIKSSTNLSTAILNLLKTYRFWSLIFNATGRVENLHSHSYIKQVQGLISKFSDGVIEKTITIRSLQEIFEYEDILLDLLNFSDKKEKITMDVMKKLRVNCRSYMMRMDQLRTFYDNFCPIEKVKDVQKFLDDINNRNSNTENLTLKDAMAPNHWDFHKKNVHCAIRVHRIAKSHTFRNIFEDIMKVEEVDLTVENIAQTIMPSVFEKYDQLCQQYKEWEKLKCSKGSVLWKNVADIEKELEMMKENMQLENSEKLIQTLAHLSLVPTQVERLQQLSTVAVMFKVAHTKDDWLERLLVILRDDYLWLGKLIDFFDIFNHYLGLIDDDCWDLIKELSQAGDFIVFLHKIAEHDIKNLINGVDESSDERLIQEDTVSSLIQVKQFLLPLLKTAEKSSLEEFLDEIRAITQQNAKLGNKVALCNNNNMALQNLYNSISNKGEVTREKISSAVKRGTYTFERDNKGDACKVTLSYPTVKGTKQPSYTLTDLHDLRGRALLISKPSASVDIVTNQTPGVETEEVSKPIMDEFVKQVDMAQEIINLSTKLIQTGHFSYRTFKREIKGTENMIQAVAELKAHLKEWEEIVNKAQEEFYYLTFFPARHILTFLDYFSVSDKANEIAEKYDDREHEITEKREDMKDTEEREECEDIEKREGTEQREDTEHEDIEKREDTERREEIEKREGTEEQENENIEGTEITKEREISEISEENETTKRREIVKELEIVEEHEIIEEWDNIEEHRDTEECEKLIRFVNSKAKLPPKDQITINLGNNYYQILGEIGTILQGIFGTIPKEERKVESVKERVITDVVYPGKLFVAACDDKFLVPNIIMSLYVNHKYYPLPWQLLICTTSTTMEELAIFVKRCFFANNNGYGGTLFCLANLELLDFELQYNLVNLIRSMREKHNNFQLALICYREQGLHHHILDQFSQDVHATNGLSGDAMKVLYHELYPNTLTVSSELSGQGKSEWIRQSSYSKKLIPKSFLISDEADFKTLVHRFKEFKIRPFESVHLNIVSADNPIDVNMFLFELLTLGIVFCNMDVAFLPDTLVYIEIASTMEQHLFKSLPIAGYLQRTHLTWDVENLVVSQDIDSPIQVVCHYLKELGNEEAINEKDIDFTDLEPLPAAECRGLIRGYLFKRNTNDSIDAKDISSYRFIEIFINVFADQLVRLSLSSFFQVENLKLMVEENNIRSTLVETLLNVSKDFATKSIATKAAQKENISTTEDETAILGTIVQWDDSNHLLVFFLSQTPDSICALYRDKEKVPQNVKILLKSQHIGDKSLWDLDDYHTMDPSILLSTLENLARKTMYKLEYPQYALSADNLIKMALILLRARANIPVIVCGEAGCGKTSLIGFLAKVVEVEFHALNLHAGVTEDAILHFMRESQEKAKKGEVWLFFDEINTCNHIGLLADLIAHRILNGKPIHNNIRLFAACNPYRIRTKAATTAGLLKPKDSRFEEKSKLVYQVKPLPDQILDYVWDYGVLKPKEEEKYIEIMVSEQLKELGHKVLSECLFASQGFIRTIESSYSVSLRDVKRAITLVKFFIKSFEDRPPIKRFGKVKKYPEPSDITINVRCYIIALGLSYQSRIYEQNLRKEYRKRMGEIFRKHKFNIDEERFSNIIREEQEDYINRMQCPPNTAKNEALLENVLVMIVCILTKIPCFIIGAPGSSKSLAVRLISQNLRGSDSNDEYFRRLPQVYLIPHQGSSSSTSEGINKVFQKAVAYQETSSEEFPVLSVVLLDEVGLAETSPFNPLKVLHSLLEPSYPAVGPTVSCIAISNWRLDNSKSSRALLVQRPKFELEDLTDTASRLLIKSENSQISIASLNLLAQSYLNYEQNGQDKLPNFHGLRDYYSLVKSLSQYSSLTPENIQMALIRNFGGVDNIRQLIEKYFGQVIRYFNSSKEFNYKHIPIGDLINANLEDKDARHLMVIGKSDSIVNLLNYQLRKKGLDPVIILGSQFPEDQDDYSYSVLSRIMMCVETGRPLILTDLEIIYGSLYDLWNQNYIVVGSEDDPKFYARVALGAYANPMLYVAPTFRCILVMDESKLEKADPPLLNRFEKQKMTMNDTLTQQEHELVDTLKEWTKLISTITDKKNMLNIELKGFTEKDLFIGFDESETLQSLVIDVKKSFPEAEEDEILFKCKEKLVKIASSDGMIRAERSNLNLEEVKQWKNIYFNEQHHDNLTDHIQYCLSDNENYNEGFEGLQIVINTFSNINTDIKSRLQYITSCQIDKLSTFKTESQFQNRIKYFWNESQDKMLILQCDVTTINAGCIKLAKFLIEQYRNEYLQKRRLQSQLQQDTEQSLSWSLKNSQSKQPQKDLPIKHVCIILHIHREQENSLASFNFMCGWDQVTIETLLPQEKDLSLLLNDNLSDLISTVYPFEEILKQELLWCLLCLKFPSNFKSVEHIKMLNEKIYKNPTLVNLLKTRTVNWLKEHSNNTNWQYEVSSNKKLLYPYSSFANALLAHIRRVIRKPIAKLLYALEKYAAIYTIIFLYEKSITNKDPVKFAMEGVESSDTIKEISDDNIMSDDACLLEFWNKMVDDDNVISIEGLKVDPSPDSYVMPHGVYELEFPFSYYIMKKIDDSRRVYEEELLSLYNNQENIDKTTGELRTHVVEGYNKKFINNIEKSPIIKNSPIANYPEKYFKDFINVILSDKVSSGEKDGNLDEKLLKFIFERRLGADNVLNPIRLHSYWWKNSSSILAELSLAQMSPNVITQIETEKENEENKILLDVEFEIYLVEQVIRNLLSRIIDAKEGEHEGLRNLRIIERWQYEVTKVLSLCEKINVSFKLYSLQLLRICNDLLVTKSIPLGDMKRIIEYAQQQNANSSSDGAQNEIITEGFINIVMKILTNLEPSENNLIPRRLFILRCLDMLTLESPVRLYLYRGTFSSPPFPIMGAIISRIFRTEEKECPNSILHLIQQPKQILQHSGRLATINECFNINNLNVMMAALICDTFQQEFFSKLDLVALVDGFNSAINTLYENDIQPLQRIASIAFLKEFTNQFWKYIIKRNEDYLQPITHNLLETESFDGTLLMEQFNNTMSIPHPLITSFGLYLLRELRINREFSGDEIKKFCEAQSKNLNWFDNFNIDDKNESRLPFNPYWAVPSYGKLEIAFTLLYNDDNRPQFNSIFQQYNDKAPDLSDKLGLFGIIVAKLHSIRASREWKLNENQISQYFGQKITDLTTIPEDFKVILFNVLANTHPLLKINEVITNSELLIKSVIAHIIGLHVLLDPNTTPLSLYMHKIADAQKAYILACQSDMENLLFNAIAEREGVSRYSCQCGYKYLIGECGGAMEESKCPECKKTIGGLSHVTAEGNTRLDVENKYSFESNDQKGYISEKINDDINYTMRYLTPVAYRILHLIVHAIIGSQASSPDSIALIQQHSKDYTNVEDYCMEHIKNDWNSLKQILNCSDENLALTFHSLVLTLDQNLPSCNSTLYSSYSRNQWETAFSQTTVLELTRNVNESAAKFRAQIEQNMKKVDVKNSLLEELINQTNLMDERYTRENLPSLWRVIGRIDYNSFRAYYFSDPKHTENHPFLNIFFKHSKNLHLIKYLYPMVKFIQILSTKLGYKISRDDAKKLTFRKFIENESNDGKDKDTYDTLDKYFNEFQTSYNTIINMVERYQCHTFKIKPHITDNESIVYGFMEGKDEGIYLCAIIEYLINIQNNFLREIMLIKSGSCNSLRFLQSPSWDVITSSADNSPYIIKSMRVDRAIESNFIVYEWDDEILKYSQRNLEVGKGQYIIYDLHRIESELANTLVYSKVHFEGGNEQLVLDPFPYHLELFSSSIRILGEIKSLIPQEEIPSEKLTLIIGQQSVPSYLSLSASLSTLTSKDNSSELLSLLEILLCFIKRTSIGDGNLLLNEFINQWVQLSSLTENSRFKTILSYDLQLKHVVSLYEVIEEQVANIMIQFIDKKFKEPLTDDMKKDLDDAIDFEGGNKGKIPADSFIIAMKRFIQRVLQTESDKETHPLNTYVTDMSLSLWPINNVIEEVLDDKFPDTLLVANSFAAYEYVLQKKEISKSKQSYSGGNKPPSFNTSSISETTASSSSQSTQPSAFTLKNKGKKVIRDE